MDYEYRLKISAEQLDQTADKIDRLDRGLEKVFAKKYSVGIDKSDVQSLTSSMEKLGKTLESIQVKSTSGGGGIAKTLSDAEKAAVKAEKTISKLASTINNSLGKLDLFKGASSSKTSGYAKVLADYEETLKKMKAVQEQMKTASSSPTFDASQLANYETKIASLKQTLSAFETQLKGTTYNLTNSKGTVMGIQVGDIINDKTALEGLTKSLADYYKVASENVNVSVTGNGRVTAEIQQENGEILKLKGNYDSVNGTIRRVSETTQSATSQMKSGFSGANSEIQNLVAGFLTLRTAINGIKAAVGAVKELEDGLSTISMTMDLTDAQLDSLGDAVVKKAKEMGTSISDTLDVSKIYANMQASPAQIMALTTPTIELANAAGLSTATASDYIQAVLNQFNLAETEAEHVADVFENISANIKMDFAQGIGTIADGVEAAGAVANASGMGFEKFSAVVAKTAETTRESGGKIGNTWKTILSRISNASKLSDDFDPETISNAAKSLAGVGIQVYEQDGTFRNVDETLTQLAAKWDSLTDAQQANISYNVAGMRNVNLFRVALESYADATTLAANAMTASGTAAKNQEIYLSTFEAKLTNLSNAAKSFGMSLVNADLTRGLVSGLTSVLEVINNLIDATGSLAPVFSSLLVGFGVGTLGKLFNVAPIVAATDKVKDFFGAMVSGSSSISGIGGSIASFFSSPLGAIAAVTTAVSVGITAYNNYRQKLIDTANAATQSWTAQKEALGGQLEQVKALRDQLADPSITDEQTVSIKSQLLDLQKQIVEQYGLEAGQIDLINGDLATQLATLQNISREQANKLLADRETRKAYEDATKEMSANRYVEASNWYNPDSVGEGAKEAAKLFYDKLEAAYAENGFAKDSYSYFLDPGTDIYTFEGTAKEVSAATSRMITNLQDLKTEFAGADENIGITIDNQIAALESSLSDADAVIDKYAENAAMAKELEVVAEGGGKIASDYETSIKAYNAAVEEAASKNSWDSDELKEARETLLETQETVDEVLKKHPDWAEYFSGLDGEIDTSKEHLETFWSYITGKADGSSTDVVYGLAQAVKESGMTASQVTSELQSYNSSTNDAVTAAISLGQAYGLISDSVTGAFDASQISAFVDVLVDAGIVTDDMSSSVSDAKTDVEGLGEAAEKTGKSLAEMFGDTEFRSQLSGFKSSMSDLDEALAKIAEGDYTNEDFLALSEQYTELMGHQDDMVESISRLKADKIIKFANEYSAAIKQLTSTTEKEQATSYLRDLMESLDMSNLDIRDFSDFINEKFGIDDDVSGTLLKKRQQALSDLMSAYDFANDQAAKEVLIQMLVDPTQGIITLNDFEKEYNNHKITEEVEVKTDNAIRTMAQLFANETYDKYYKEYSASIGTLSSAYESLKEKGELTGDELESLYKEFPQLTEVTGDLSTAIQDLEADKIIQFAAQYRDLTSSMTDSSQRRQAQAYFGQLVNGIDLSGVSMRRFRDAMASTFNAKMSGQTKGNMMDALNSFIKLNNLTNDTVGREIALKLALEAGDFTTTMEKYKARYREMHVDLRLDASKEATADILGVISNIQNVINSQAAGTSVDVSIFDDKQLADYSSALEYANGQVRLNAEAVRDLTRAKAAEVIAQNDANKAIAQTQYVSNTQEIIALREKLSGLTEGTREYESTVSQISQYQLQNDSIEDACIKWDSLNASIRNATGEYQAWLNAQKAPNSGDMYNDAQAMVAEIQRINDAEKAGEDYMHYGLSTYKAAVDFLVPDTIDSSDEQAVLNYVNSLGRYISEDGSSSLEQLGNFLDDAVSAGLMRINESGAYEIAGEQSMQSFADGLGLSLPLVEAIFGELEETGKAHFDFGDAIDSIEDLRVRAADAYNELSQISAFSDVDIKLDYSDYETAEEKLAAVEQSLAELGEVNVAELDASQYDNFYLILQDLAAEKAMLEAPVIMSIDTSDINDEPIANALALVQELLAAQAELEEAKNLGLDTSEAQAKVDSITAEINGLEGKTVNAVLGFKEDEALTADAIVQKAKALTDKDLSMTIKANGTQAKRTLDSVSASANRINDKSIYVSAHDYASSILRNVINYLSQIRDKTITVTTYHHTVNTSSGSSTKRSGNHDSASAAGTAHVRGTAYASGDWGAKYGGRALVGELGPEMIINPHTGKWYTVGDNGAEFVNIPKNAIIFNAAQTAELMSKEFTASRGLALAMGTAYASNQRVSGSISLPKAPTTTASASQATKAVTSAASSVANTASSAARELTSTAESTADENKNVLEAFKDWVQSLFDWIEVKLNHLANLQEEYYGKADFYEGRGLDKNGNYKNAVSNRTSGIDYTRQLLETNRQGQGRYMTQAETVYRTGRQYLDSLDARMLDQIVKIINNGGTVDISEAWSEEVQEIVKDYQQWYGKATECRFAITELSQSLYENSKALADLPLSRAGDQLDVLSDKVSVLDAKAKAAAKGISTIRNMADIATGTALSKELSKYRGRVTYEYQNQLEKQSLDAARSEYGINADSVDNLKKMYDAAIAEQRKYEKELKSRQNSILLTSYKNKLSREQLTALNKGAGVATVDLSGGALTEVNRYNETVDRLQLATWNAANAQRNLNAAMIATEKATADYAAAQATYASNTIKNIQNYYDAISDYYAIVTARRENVLSTNNAFGLDSTREQYEDVISGLTGQREKLIEESKALTDQLNALMDQGIIDRYSEEWRELDGTIRNIDNQAAKLGIDIKGVKDDMRDDVLWRNFKRAHDEIDATIDSLRGLGSLIESESYFEDNGDFTRFGLGKLTELSKQYQMASNDVKNYQADIDNLNKLYQEGYYSANQYTEKINELRSDLLDAAGDMQSAWGDMQRMFEESMKIELDGVFDLIDAQKELLNKTKEYQDYTRTITSKNRDINLLKSQLAALSGAEGLEAQAQRTRLEEQLRDKEDDLQETVNNHILDLSTDALDELRDELQNNYDIEIKKMSGDLDTISEYLLRANEITEAGVDQVKSAMTAILSHYGIGAGSGITAETLTGAASGGHVNRIIKQNGDDGILSVKLGEEIVTAQVVKMASDVLDGFKALGVSDGLGILPRTTLPAGTAGTVKIEQHYDSLLTVNGDIDKEVFPGVQAMCEKAFEYNTERTREALVRAGQRKIL